MGKYWVVCFEEKEVAEKVQKLSIGNPEFTLNEQFLKVHAGLGGNKRRGSGGGGGGGGANGAGKRKR